MSDIKINTKSRYQPLRKVERVENVKQTTLELKAKYKFSRPLKGELSSAFGIRINPMTDKEEFHPGVDFEANSGTIIRAVVSGVVIDARRGLTFGNFIRISTGTDVITTYAHCSKLLVKKGQKIKAGQKIALSGNTGMSTGAHLHVEITRDGRYVNPTELFR